MSTINSPKSTGSPKSFSDAASAYNNVNKSKPSSSIDNKKISKPNQQLSPRASPISSPKRSSNKRSITSPVSKSQSVSPRTLSTLINVSPSLQGMSSPISYDTNNTLVFDYNVFVTTWQDSIRLKHYEKCEKYCRDLIQKLLAAEQASNTNKKDETNDKKVKESYCEYRSKVHFSLGYLLKKYMKNYEEAKKQYELSIESDNENPGAHFNLANMLVDYCDDYANAEYHFRKAIALEPYYLLYRMTYAEFLWHDCKKYDESGSQYEELISIVNSNGNNNDSHCEDIYFNYGLLLRDHLKLYEKACQQFEAVLKINPNDKEAQQELSFTNKMLNKNNLNPNGDGGHHNHDNPNDADKNHKEEEKETIEKFSKKRNSSFRHAQHDIVLPQSQEFEKLAKQYKQSLEENSRAQLQLKNYNNFFQQ